jgi:hypothetical protein
MQRAMSVFMPCSARRARCSYQWEEPFVVDDSRFRERFGVVPEDADRAAAATVAWARASIRLISTSRTTRNPNDPNDPTTDDLCDDPPRGGQR